MSEQCRKIGSRYGLGLLTLVLSFAPLCAQSPASRLISAHPRVDPQTPVALRAETVFEAVTRAADAPVGVVPSLVLSEVEGRTWAFASEDGRVVVTRKALELCYQEGLDEIGDARLALVVAHELDHLAQGDFSHFSAFSSQADLSSELSSDRRAAEIRADRQAAVYMWIAGYPPKTLLQGGSSFFDEWAGQALLEGTYADDSHPSPEQRNRIFKRRLQEVLENLENFESGLRAYQIGAYDLAVRLLEPFARRFPARAVMNNLGVSYLQLAVLKLARCNGSLALRFKVPILIDPVTLAEGSTRRGTESVCYALSDVVSNLESARAVLEKVIQLDPDYYPARLNHASLLVLAGRGAGALSSLEKLPDPRKRQPDIRLLAALATYLHGEEEAPVIRGATRSEALARLRELHRANPRSTMVLYNLASIESEISGPGPAKRLWEAFVELEPSSPYAEFARERLGLDPGELTAPLLPAFSPPVPLGPVGELQQQWLESQAFDRRRLESDHTRITLYSNSDYRVLREGSRLLFIEKRLADGLRTNELRLGSPQRIIESTTQSFWAFRGLGLVVEGEQATTMVFFER